MEYKSSEVKAGLFIFISILALIAMIFALGNLQDMFHEKKTLRIRFPFTGGLALGAPVRYSGLDVGKVVDIDLFNTADEKGEDRVMVVAEIDPKIIIKKNSTASIKTSGLMGGMYIDIRSGTRSSPPLSDKEYLNGVESFEFTKIGDMMGDVVLQVARFIEITDALASDSRKTLEAVQKSVDSVNQVVRENRPAIRSSLQNISRASDDLSRLLTNNEKDIQHIITEMASASTGAKQILSDNGKNLEAIIKQTLELTREMQVFLADNRPGVTRLIRTMETDTHEISMNISSATASLEETLQQSNHVVVENRRNLKELLNNLRATSVNMKELTDELQRNPWKLVRKGDEAPPKAAPYVPPVTGQKELRMRRLDKTPAN
ncbi:MAG: MCE family protein [Candidatus Nitrohelix vancouverensis]|uniref:MCE family protein n=1 Tax=Candidatus Nitrohelix vancouverensis TaxID=2705534 RepID=A0A7T0C1A6_9BACT|nr:MAG: MCE family protein [Candidatus Nitrohelix vancouverensis]